MEYLIIFADINICRHCTQLQGSISVYKNKWQQLLSTKQVIRICQSIDWETVIGISCRPCNGFETVMTSCLSLISHVCAHFLAYDSAFYIYLAAFLSAARSDGIVAKCWLHTWQALLSAYHALWSFSASRIPLPPVLSPSLLSFLSSSIFFTSFLFPWIKLVALYCFRMVWNRNHWLFTLPGIRL